MHFGKYLFAKNERTPNMLGHVCRACLASVLGVTLLAEKNSQSCNLNVNQAISQKWNQSNIKETINNELAITIANHQWNPSLKKRFPTRFSTEYTSMS
uniref:Uncharacterized protein n=1 Tax=Romanomermis culicivorax TaxID=13658 RepID=A0A915HJ34_ROMCU